MARFFLIRTFRLIAVLLAVELAIAAMLVAIVCGVPAVISAIRFRIVDQLYAAANPRIRYGS